MERDNYSGGSEQMVTKEPTVERMRRVSRAAPGTRWYLVDLRNAQAGLEAVFPAAQTATNRCASIPG